MDACLFQGKSNVDLYEWPTHMIKSVTPRPQAHFVESTTLPLHLWQVHLGHHQPTITKACVSCFNIPMNHVESYSFVIYILEITVIVYHLVTIQLQVLGL